MGQILFGLIVVSLIFIPLERLFPLRRDQKVFRTGWGTDLVHFLFNRSITELTSFAVAVVIVILLHGLVNPDFQAAVAAQPGWVQFLEALVIADFSGYWGHRFAHQHPFLWKFHAIHHSSGQLDWLAAARLHPLDQTFIRAFQIVPLYLMGFSKETFGAFVILLTLQGIFLHANTRFTFGWLKWFINTPEYHHWHHSRDAEAVNRNFAGLFPVFDMIFGTQYLPKNRRPQEYGIHEVIPPSYLKQMAWPFRKTA